MIKLYTLGVEFLEAMTAKTKLTADAELAATEAALAQTVVQTAMIKKAAKDLVGGNQRVIHFTVGDDVVTEGGVL